MEISQFELDKWKIETSINIKKHDLEKLEHDLKSVYSELSRQSIQEHIKSIKRYIERQEFKLWKLEKENDE